MLFAELQIAKICIHFKGYVVTVKCFLKISDRIFVIEQVKKIQQLPGNPEYTSKQCTINTSLSATWKII